MAKHLLTDMAKERALKTVTWCNCGIGMVQMFDVKRCLSKNRVQCQNILYSADKYESKN
jgi:hypothetical protein